MLESTQREGQKQIMGSKLQAILMRRLLEVIDINSLMKAYIQIHELLLYDAHA